jgi:hypothetical protein
MYVAAEMNSETFCFLIVHSYEQDDKDLVCLFDFVFTTAAVTQAVCCRDFTDCTLLAIRDKERKLRSKVLRKFIGYPLACYTHQ